MKLVFGVGKLEDKMLALLASECYVSLSNCNVSYPCIYEVHWETKKYNSS